MTILHADITVPSTLSKMMDAMGEEKADLVICDGAPEGKRAMTPRLHGNVADPNSRHSHWSA